MMKNGRYRPGKLKFTRRPPIKDTEFKLERILRCSDGMVTICELTTKDGVKGTGIARVADADIVTIRTRYRCGQCGIQWPPVHDGPQHRRCPAEDCRSRKIIKKTWRVPLGRGGVRLDTPEAAEYGKNLARHKAMHAIARLRKGRPILNALMR
jgi:DNA-directed RNA polymerase subunit RPC12/RpoP